MALIGYCFGGSVALSHALSGQTCADAAIAFHGGIGSVTKDLNTTVNTKLTSTQDEDTSKKTSSNLDAQWDDVLGKRIPTAIVDTGASASYN